MPRTPANPSPLEPSEPVRIKPTAPARPGRKPKLGPPPMPLLEMTPDEALMYSYFLDAIEDDYPNLKNSDRLLLPIVAAEYIKYLRMLQEELKSGKLVSMARQHPGTMFARFMAQLLGTTRNQRMKAGNESSDEESFDWSKLSA